MSKFFNAHLVFLFLPFYSVQIFYFFTIFTGRVRLVKEEEYWARQKLKDEAEQKKKTIIAAAKSPLKKNASPIKTVSPKTKGISPSKKTSSEKPTRRITRARKQKSRLLPGEVSSRQSLSSSTKSSAASSGAASTAINRKQQQQSTKPNKKSKRNVKAGKNKKTRKRQLPKRQNGENGDDDGIELEGECNLLRIMARVLRKGTNKQRKDKRVKRNAGGVAGTGGSSSAGVKTEDGKSTAKDEKESGSSESKLATLGESEKLTGTLHFMSRLGKQLLPLKRDFLVVNLFHQCFRCRSYITQGGRWTCRACETRFSQFIKVTIF